ncbi:MAG TPA: competence/damage-inducible protein A [Solirubrobacteraceae bacterium]|nr:competence/damage-inducible protein A [Solirubrobacteraceae bacterium]
MSTRAAIVVTGTEVLSGRVSDRNGPWLSERLGELGVDLAHVTVVGDRPRDMLAALQWCGSLGVELVVTSGGLGPTADDLTATVVGEFCGREMVLDEELEERIAAIVLPLRARWPHLTEETIREANRKQALIPTGATVLEPVGTAPGLVVPPAEGRDGPTVVVLPGPPRELQPLWERATETEAFAHAVRDATVYEQRTLRMFGLPESEIATTLRAVEAAGVPIEQIEITTCVRGGELEIVTRYEPHAAEVYEAFERIVRERHERVLYSYDGSRVDDQVASMLIEQGLSVAVAESCTGGLMLGRLTDRPGSSAYVRGGIVAYANDVKVGVAGVPAELVERHGAVSEEVALALAQGARKVLGADIGIGVTGVAGPGGGTEEKPVGTVWLALVRPGGQITRRADQRGSRADIRERSTTSAMHLLRRLLLGESDAAAA